MGAHGVGGIKPDSRGLGPAIHDFLRHAGKTAQQGGVPLGVACSRRPKVNDRHLTIYN